MLLRDLRPVAHDIYPEDGSVISVEPGVPFDVPDDLAARLLEQVGNYEAVTPKKKGN